MAIDLESLLESGVAWRVVHNPKLELPRPRPKHWRPSKRQVAFVHVVVVGLAMLRWVAAETAVGLLVWGWSIYALSLWRRAEPPTAIASTYEGIIVAVGEREVIVPWDQIDARGDVKVEWGFTNLVVVRTKTEFAFGRVFVMRREVPGL